MNVDEALEYFNKFREVANSMGVNTQKIFGESEQKSMDVIIEKLKVEPKDNFFDYYDKENINPIEYK